MSERFRSTRAAVTVACCALALAASAPIAAGGYERGYRVTVTNLTGGNQFTPVLAATHTPEAAFFVLGDAPSDPLATLAETGSTAPLQDVLESLDAVSSALTAPGPDGGLTFAGHTVSFEIDASRRARRLSVAAMILPTNDAFVAVDSVPLPRRGSRTVYALGYDAGSEGNDELCASIPGPLCGDDGEGPAGEGFVHVSRGIQGIGDVPAAEYDWRNPVAKVTITRIR